MIPQQPSQPLARPFAVLLAAAALSACAGPAPAPDAADASIVQSSVSGDAMMEHLLTQTATAEEKILGLAEAIPEDAYAWRPMEGVRSTAEVFLHVAADNYFLPVIMGVDAPAETGITTEYETVRAYEAREASKAEVLAMLGASFSHLEQAAAATRGDLSTELSFGSRTFTMGGLWTQAVVHLHEHLGQAVAYARANEVVPPWSM